MQRENNYDYIIAGAGCAGLSLLYHLLMHPATQHQKILVVDANLSVPPHKTWCFWEKQDGIFETIVKKSWTQLRLKDADQEQHIALEDYTYKMIHSADFYHLILNFARKFKTVTFLETKVNSFCNLEDIVVVNTDHGIQIARYVFDSTTNLLPAMDSKNTLLQHFEGWKIQTPAPVFNASVATLMDFNIPQDQGTAFFYLLPENRHTALIEYTVFSPQTFSKAAYQTALENYIQKQLGIDAYQIIEKEHGVIPMSTARFKQHTHTNIIHIGTAGGQTKASTGYTFYFIQKQCEQLIAALEAEEVLLPLKKTFSSAKYQWYDRTLLDVLLHRRQSGQNVFSRLFRKNNPEAVLRFLNNESSLREELKIMSSVSILPFLKSGLRQLV